MNVLWVFTKSSLKLKVGRSRDTSWFHFFSLLSFFSVLKNVSLKTSIIFLKNKNNILTMCLPQVRRKTEFSPQTGKPNKKVSKTTPDNRQSFINKDVLSTKIMTAAKPNITQDPELLSGIWQQPFLKESVQRKAVMLRGLLPFKKIKNEKALHLSQSTFQQYHLLICVPHRDCPEGLGVLGFPAAW